MVGASRTTTLGLASASGLGAEPSPIRSSLSLPYSSEGDAVTLVTVRNTGASR
jgi:hypothetical protein